MSRSAWTYEAALEAIELRRRGMSYTGIAIAVEHIHGIRTNADGARRVCRQSGCPPKMAGRQGENFRNLRNHTTAA